MNIQYYATDGTVKNLGDDELQHWKYIKKIKTGSGWRYFYSPEELRQFYNEGKKKADSIPRLQKHGDKYYIADKKTQRNIEKSGVGGNVLYRNKKGDLGPYKNYRPTDNQVSKWIAKDRMANAKGKEADNGRKGDKNIVGKAMSAATAASETSKIKARESAYSKYEAKNVTNRKISEIKNKTNKGKSAVEKKLKKVKKTTKNEVEGVKRVTKAINKAGKAKSQGTKYSKNGKTYRNWKEVPSGTFKLYNGKTIGYDYHPTEEKKKKTGKAERAILSVYRKTPKGKRWSLTR